MFTTRNCTRFAATTTKFHTTPAGLPDPPARQLIDWQLHVTTPPSSLSPGGLPELWSLGKGEPVLSAMTRPQTGAGGAGYHADGDSLTPTCESCTGMPPLRPRLARTPEIHTEKISQWMRQH